MRNVNGEKIFSDGLTALFNMVNEDQTKFMDYALSTILYLNPDDVQQGWSELIDSIQSGNHVYIRYSKVLFGNETLTMANQRTRQEPQRHPMHPNIRVIVDPNGNLNAQQAFSRMSGIPRGELLNYTLTHIWGKTDNPFAFTSGWNLAMTPNFLAALTDEKRYLGEEHISSKFKRLFRAIAFELYKDVGNGTWIQLCEIEQPDVTDLEKARQLITSNKINILCPSPIQTGTSVGDKKKEKSSQAISRNKELDIKIGRLVETSIHRLVGQGILSREHLTLLTDKNYCKDIFGIRYPLLKAVEGKSPISEQRKVNGRDRYYSTAVNFQDMQFLVCNDLYEKNRTPFLQWLSRLA